MRMAWLFLFLCKRIRRQSRSTLFPYTTLFRSGAAFGLGTSLTPILTGIAIAVALGLLVALLRVASGRVDRKSTRLNSSHVEISYAVFCLKKKNMIIIVH